MNKKSIGIVGLGLMGYNMGLNLVNKGFDVYGYDIAPASRERFLQTGGKTVDTCAELGTKADTIILMVFNADQIRDVLFGAGDLAANMKAGSSIIVTASVGNEIMEEVYEKLQGTGIMLVDATVRASAASAAEGKMYIMVGAEDHAFAAVEDVLNAMGNEILRVGDKPGYAQLMKSCMQAFFSLTFEITAEVLALGTAAGLDPKLVYDVLNATGASSNLFRGTAANIASGTFTGTNNPMAILEKDAKLAVKLGKENGLNLLALAGTAQNFENCMKKHGTDDIWACVKDYEESGDIQVRFNID